MKEYNNQGVLNLMDGLYRSCLRGKKNREIKKSFVNSKAFELWCSIKNFSVEEKRIPVLVYNTNV